MRRALLAVATALGVLALLPVPAQAATSPQVSVQRITVPGGPGVDGTVELDTTLYLPATTPAPAVLVAHGFGGSKASVDGDARELVARGFVVLTWSARGFGTSGGQIGLDSPDYEVADAQRAGRLAGRPPRGAAGRARRSAGRRHRRLLRRGAVAAARRLRPPDRRDRAGDHLERPGAGAVPERRQQRGAARRQPGARVRSPRTACSSAGWAGMFFSAGLGPAQRGGPPPPGPADVRPVPRRHLRRLHRGRHHRPALARADRAAAPLLPRVGHRPDHRTDAARAGRVGHAVRAGPGRRQRPPDRRARHAGVGALVRGRPRRRPARHRHPRPRSATGSTSTSPAGEPHGRGRARSATPCRAGSVPAASTPTGRTVLADTYPGLAGAAPVAFTQAAAAGRSAGRPEPGRRQPGRDHVAARARRRAGQRRRPGGRAHRGAARPVRPVPHRPAGRAAAASPARRGSRSPSPGSPASRRRPRRCCSRKTYEVAPDGTRTLLGSAVAPIRVAGAAGRAPRRSPSRCPAWWRRSRRATGCWCRSAPPTRATPAPPSPRSGWSALTGGRRRARVPGRGRHAPTPCRSRRSIGIGIVLVAALVGLAGRPRAAAPPATVVARTRTATAAGDRGTSPRPTRAGSRAVHGRVVRRRARAWCWACSARTAPARPPCCACSWA